MKIDPVSRPSVIGPGFTGHFRVSTDTPRGLQPFQPGPDLKQVSGKPHPSTEQASTAKKIAPVMAVGRNIYDQRSTEVGQNSKDKTAPGEESASNGAPTTESDSKTAEAAAPPKKATYCTSCGVDCTRLHYHYGKSLATGPTPILVEYDVCTPCFVEGRYPQSHESASFVLLENPNYSTVPDRDAPWSDAELLLLLEGLEAWDDDWNSIADHVGSRTREECVMKFLQLEIEDPYLEEAAETSADYKALNYDAGEPFDHHAYEGPKVGRLPLHRFDNPVLSVVSFLAGMSEPAVAAAAAGKSVQEMRRSMRSKLENGTGDKGKEKATSKAEDSMEIDDAPSPQADENNQVAISDEPHPQSRATLPTIALAASAARAASLASHEEREMTRLVGAAVNLMLQKFELKLSQFAEMEAVLQAERQELERGRQQLFLDRLAFKKRTKEVQEALRRMSISGQAGPIPASREEKLGFINVTGRAEDDFRPLTTADEGHKTFEI
jgi:SWI/SNF related-matrix-associated actin-dependent regulator of chromatin subfamily C